MTRIGDDSDRDGVGGLSQRGDRLGRGRGNNIRKIMDAKKRIMSITPVRNHDLGGLGIIN